MWWKSFFVLFITGCHNFFFSLQRFESKKINKNSRSADMKMMFWSKFSFLLKWIKKKKKNFNLHLTQGRITNNPNCIINTKANNPSFITFHLHELALRNAFWNLCLITVRSISVKHRNRELWLISAIPSQLMLTSPSQNKGCYRSKSLWLMEGWEND
jgi:hypothetical protein